MALTPYVYRTQVIRVVDGDTLWCRIDLGFRTQAEHSIRLAGIDAPELFTGTDREAGAASRDAVQTWVDEWQDICDDEWPFVLHSDKGGGFGRWAGTLWRMGDSRALNSWLVDAGFAVESQP